MNYLLGQLEDPGYVERRVEPDDVAPTPRVSHPARHLHDPTMRLRTSRSHDVGAI